GPYWRPPEPRSIWSFKRKKMVSKRFRTCSWFLVRRAIIDSYDEPISRQLFVTSELQRSRPPHCRHRGSGNIAVTLRTARMQTTINFILPVSIHGLRLLTRKTDRQRIGLTSRSHLPGREMIQQVLSTRTEMNIFISWSGERSKRAALALKSLLESVFQRA